MSAVLEGRGLERTASAAGQTLRILDGVDVAVAAGEVLAVGGPSGSGKTTLLALLGGLDRPTRGQVLYRGLPLPEEDGALSAWRRARTGFVFQSFRLVPTLTALENAALPLELLGRPAREARAAARELLALVGLSGREGHFPDQLSGGEQQRAAIARALVHGPELVFADEPTGALDRDTAERVLDCLVESCRGRGAALVVVSHDPAVAERADRALRLTRGRLDGL